MKNSKFRRIINKVLRPAVVLYRKIYVKDHPPTRRQDLATQSAYRDEQTCAVLSQP
jgi:hypothetical protein